MKKIIVIENETIKNKVEQSYKGKLNIFVLGKNNQKDLLKLILKEKADAGIFINKNYEVHLIHRKLGGWKTINNFTLDLLVLEDLKIKPKFPKSLSKKIPFGTPDDKLSFTDKGILYQEDQISNILNMKILILENDDFNGKIKSFNNKWGYFHIEQKNLVKKKAVAFESFTKDIKNNKVLPGLKTPSKVSEEDGRLQFNMGISSICINNKEEIITVISLTASNNEVESHYQHKGIIRNIENNIYSNTIGEYRKLKKREIILSLFGLFVFILLTVITFTKILDPSEVKLSFKILFSWNTLSHAWIYLLWANFFFSFLFSFIMMYIISFAIQRKRPNAKAMLTYFVASQIRATARFITGEAIIGTFLWGWYIVKKNNIRTSSLVGAVATLSVFRGIFTFIIGIIFMIIGQVYLSGVFSYVDSLTGDKINTTLFYVLSWGGLVWILFDRFVRSSIVYLPPIHYLYNKIYTRIILFKKNPNVFTNMENREMSLISLKSSTKNLLLNKERIYRISLMIFIAVLIEALELMYIFNIVEIYNASINPLYDKVLHTDFMNISGGRYMISMVHNFPLINVTPGNGIGFIEYFMSNAFGAMYLYSHNSTDLAIAGSFADQTTFITRFFNSYLQMMLSSIITGYVFTKIMLRRRK